jgi:hypothetical protein
MMSGYLNHIALLSLNLVDSVQPRQASLFEPTATGLQAPELSTDAAQLDEITEEQPFNPNNPQGTMRQQGQLPASSLGLVESAQSRAASLQAPELSADAAQLDEITEERPFYPNIPQKTMRQQEQLPTPPKLFHQESKQPSTQQNPDKPTGRTAKNRHPSVSGFIEPPLRNDDSELNAQHKLPSIDEPQPLFSAAKADSRQSSDRSQKQTTGKIIEKRVIVEKTPILSPSADPDLTAPASNTQTRSEINHHDRMQTKPPHDESIAVKREVKEFQNRIVVEPAVRTYQPPRATQYQDSSDQSAATPNIQVTIGRIEIRATQTTEKPVAKPKATSATMSLDEYLNRRNGGKA